MTIDFEDIKRQAQDLQAYHNKSKELFKQYDDIFFMEDKEPRPQEKDPADMKKISSYCLNSSFDLL